MLLGDNLSTITEIKKCQKVGKYVTVATIYDVDLNVKWYYDSCKHFTTKALKNDAGRWVCKREKCIGSTEGSDTSIPRYQVKFRIIGTDNEVSEFVIFETQITSFIKVSAENMLSALEQDGRKDDMPYFDIFMDKQFVFKVEVHPKYNLEQNSKSYTVLSMSDDQDMVAHWATKYLDIKEAEVGSMCHDLKPKECVAIAENKECPSESSIGDCLITPPLKRSLSKMLEESSDDDCEVRIMGEKSATKIIIEDKYSASKKLLQVKIKKE
ncbi:uncharacterized protein LOC141628846 [Silene latifolia]|uniref:uncharacterized protein LOC141628846 n=1 Tax=Silene latifolia TaxID=37657 RepID=UPI003D77B6E5